MKRILFLIFALSLSSPAWATITFKQAANHECTSCAADSVTITPTGGSGDFLMIWTSTAVANTGCTQATVAVTDGTNTYTNVSAGSIATSSSAAGCAEMASAPTTTGSALTITATWTNGAGTRTNIMVLEATGMATSSIEDSSVNNFTLATTNPTSGSLTTTNANDFLIYCARAGTNQVGSWTAGASFTLPTNGSANRLGCQYEIVSSIQSGVTTSITGPTSADFVDTFAGFKGGAGGGGPVCQGLMTRGLGCK